MSSIPGLCGHIPTEESLNSAPAINFTTFDLKTFSVPATHKFGRCRPVTDFDKICHLGEGTYGTVYKVRDKKSDKIFALKRLKIPAGSFMPQNFLREINNLKLLKHENIANLVCIAAGKACESTYIILEYCEYVLSDIIDDERSVLNQPQIKNIMYQLFNGLDYIHKHLLFHRDISPSNILFSSSGVLKIADFGMSRKISPGNITPNVGLRWYQAPEILFGSENYDSSVDIWAAGCVFAEMMRGAGLFAGDSDFDVIKKIVDFLGTPTEAIWPGCSNLPLLRNYDLHSKRYSQIMFSFKESTATVSLLQDMLTYNPSKRPSAEKCLKYHYFMEFPLACSLEDLVQTLKASRSI